MIDWSLTPGASQIAQFMILLAAAVFIGGRFLPGRYRQRVGITVTACYLIGIVAFVLYLVLR